MVFATVWQSGFCAHFAHEFGTFFVNSFKKCYSASFARDRPFQRKEVQIIKKCTMSICTQNFGYERRSRYIYICILYRHALHACYACACACVFTLPPNSTLFTVHYGGLFFLHFLFSSLALWLLWVCGFCGFTMLCLSIYIPTYLSFLSSLV